MARTFRSQYDHIGAMEVEIMRDKTAPFASFVDAFLNAKPFAPHTRRDYERYLERYDVYTGKVSLEDALVLEKAVDWVNLMKTASGLYSANNGCMALKSMATWIAKSKYIQIQGGGSLLKGLEGPAIPKSRRTAFTDQQMDAIWAATGAWPDRYRYRSVAQLRFLVATGLRRNEARQVLVRDLELDIARGRGIVRVRAVTSKGQKDRISRLDPDAVSAIDAYMNAPGIRPTYSGPRNEPEPLFLTTGGKLFTEWGWSTWCDHIWKEIKKDTGIHGSSHLLRHTWATNYNRGMQYTGNNVYDLKREGGWSNLAIPLTYTHDRPEEELLEMPTPAEALRQRRKLKAV
jgi:integrase